MVSLQTGPASRTSRTAALAVSQATNMLLGMVLSAGLAWTLEDRAVYGSFQQIILIFTVLAGPLSIGLPNAVFFFLPRLAPSARKGFLVATHAILFITGAAVSAFLYFGSDLLGALLGSEQLPGMLRVFFPLPLFMMPAMILDAALMTQHRVVPLVLIQMGSRALTVAGVLIPTLAGPGIHVGLFVWTLIAAATEIVAIVVIFKPYRNDRIAWEPGLARRVLLFSAPIAAVTLLQPLAFSSDKFIVSAIYGAAAYAIYSNGVYAVSTSMTIITKAISVLIVDFNLLLRDGRNEEAWTMWRNVTFKLSIVIFAIVGYVTAGAPEIVAVLFSSRYESSSAVMSLAVLAIVPRCLVVGSVLQAMGRTGWYASITVVAAVANPVFVIVFGVLTGGSPFWAAAGYVFSEYTHAVYQLVMIRRVVGVPIRRVIPFAKLAILLVFSIGVGFVSFGSARLAIPASELPLARLIASTAAFGILYVYGTMLFRIAGWNEVWKPLFTMLRIPDGIVPDVLKKP